MNSPLNEGLGIEKRRIDHTLDSKLASSRGARQGQEVQHPNHRTLGFEKGFKNGSLHRSFLVRNVGAAV